MGMAQSEILGELVPAMSAQNAWLSGNGAWRGVVKRALAPDYSEGRAWFVVRTNPGCEDRALATLGSAGYDAFLPKGKREIVHHRTKAKIERTFPLLVGYAFLAMPLDRRVQHWGVVRECHGVHSVLGMGGAPLALPGREVEALRLADRQGRIRVAGAQWTAQKGQTARVMAGPFFSFTGEILDADAQGSVTLLINFLNKPTHLVLPVDELELVCELPVQTENECLFSAAT